MEKYMPFDYYTDMTGLIVDLKVFSLLIKSHLGKVAEHLEKINVDPVLFAVQWFLCVFSYNLPVESVIRVWDVFFSEGYVFLFRLGLAVLRIFRKKIFSYQNFHFAVEYLGSMSNGLRDVDLLLETANRFQVRLEDVLSLRKEFAGNNGFPSDLNLNCKNEKECKYLQGLTSDYFTFISFHQINYDENYFDQCSVRRSHCLLNFFSTDDIVVGCKNHNCLKEVPKKRLSKLFEKVFPNQAKIVMPRITLSPFFLISYVKEIIEVESLN
jgi:hypothetical protein